MSATATPQVGSEGVTGMLSSTDGTEAAGSASVNAGSEGATGSTDTETAGSASLVTLGTLTAAQKKIAAQRLQEERVALGGV